MKIGFLFPGQGAQSVGMGKDLYDEYSEIRKLYEELSEAINVDIADLTFNSSEEKLAQTKNTQIAILTMSLGILEILNKNNIKGEYAAGLSLGEYAALTYGKSLDKKDAIKIIKKRGEFMQNLLPEGDWAMAATIGMEDVDVENVCKKVKTGFAVPANYNCPGQVVVSGDKKGILEFIELAKEAGAKRVIELKTSGPFHTEKLKNASDALRSELENIEIKLPNCQVIKNIDAKPYDKSDDMKEILSKHVINSVKFSSSIEYMIKNGVDTFVEIGPGKVLNGFVKKISKDVKCININNVESLKNAIQELKSRKSALVTGGTRGIGKQIAYTLAENGYNISINYRTKTNELEEMKQDIESKFKVDCILVQGDVSNFEDSEKMVKETVRQLGKIDVLVNNAGITKDGLLMRMSKEDFETVIDVNLNGTFNVTKNVIPFMIKQKSGRIVNISSVVGVSGNAGQTNYSASKAGIIGFTKSLAKEVASRNILVNAVAPGFISTDMTAILNEQVKENINSQIPLKRMGKAEDIANVVKFLVSEESSYITGQVINVDGGMVM